MRTIKSVPLKDVTVQGAFWDRYIHMVREKVLPYQWETLNDRVPDAARSHCIKNFEIAAKRREGAFYGMVFQDSDLYKWLESVAFSLAAKPDAELEKLADAAIELIGAAQQPDGYVNTYYTIKEPQGRWTNLQQGHELYCAGHMIEAAVAYFHATGKRGLLDVSIRFADYIDTVFGLEPGKMNGYPGHQIIELALFKLYKATGERRYLKLAEYFLRQRGTGSNYFDEECAKPEYVEIFPEITPLERSYSQSHLPLVQQKQAVGHAVRAVYMYSAMADLANELDNAELLAACDAICENIAQGQMYITGAIGATSIGESFTTAYDLPNDLIYGETCASIGLMMFCRRMNALHADARYADLVERALYNTVLAGISLSGTEFYYVNPLESDPARIAANPTLKHVKPVRQKWFDCSCCPTNLARTIMGLGEYIYATGDDGLYVNLYCSGSVKDNARAVEVETEYPYHGEVRLKADGGRYKLYLRNPAAAPMLTVEIDGKRVDAVCENGYLVLEQDWRGNTVRLLLDVAPRLIYTSPKVQCNVGKAAVTRGPLVYCAEQADNGAGLASLLLPHNAAFHAAPVSAPLPAEAVALTAAAYKQTDDTPALYTERAPVLQNTDVKLIPYHLWANRGENEMRVYLSVVPVLPDSAGKSQ